MVTAPKPASLARFLMRWVAAMALLVILSVAGLGFAMHRANRASHEQFRDARQLQRTFEFEVIALRANANPSPKAWKAAGLALADLNAYDMEVAGLSDVALAYTQLKQAFDPRSPRAGETEFLDTLRRYRSGVDARMRSDQRESERLDRLALGWSAVLLLMALFGLVTGGLELWKRVFFPMLELSDAARRFGHGDLAVRVKLARRDELGELADTFNNMARSVEEREKERLRFVATVAHDLKNPLVSVGGIANLLADKSSKFSPAEQKEWLKRIVSGTRRMEALIADITDAVQLHTGKVNLRHDQFDLSQVARETLAEAAAVWPRHEFKSEIQDGVTIEGDCPRIERVLSNLLSNAAKYSPSGTEVRLILTRQGGETVLQVQDQGAGIAPDDLPRLFEPFSRLERTENSVSGTGLGLASVRKIVEAHSGKVGVESELGNGSVFTVRLPVKPTAKS